MAWEGSYGWVRRRRGEVVPRHFWLGYYAPAASAKPVSLRVHQSRPGVAVIVLGFLRNALGTLVSCFACSRRFALRVRVSVCSCSVVSYSYYPCSRYVSVHVPSIHVPQGPCSIPGGVVTSFSTYLLSPRPRVLYLPLSKQFVSLGDFHRLSPCASRPLYPSNASKPDSFAGNLRPPPL